MLGTFQSLPPQSPSPSRPSRDSLWLAVGDLKVEGEPGDEHVGVQADLVDAGRWQRYRHGNQAQQVRRRGLPVVGEGVLRPQTALEENDLQRRIMGEIIVRGKTYAYIRRS